MIDMFATPTVVAYARYLHEYLLVLELKLTIHEIETKAYLERAGISYLSK